MGLLPALVLLLVALAGNALAQSGPQIPSSELPGRERERFIDLFPQTPRIQLQDGRPAPVVTTPDRKRPVKRKPSRGRGSKAR